MHSSNETVQFLYDLIANYGEWLAYTAVFIWTALEGETVVIVGGYIANPQIGVLNVYYLIAAAWLGSFLGDQVYFYLGRRYGTRMLKRFPKMQAGVDKAVGLLNRFDVLFILTFRFFYGVRNVSSFAMGISKIDWSRFAVLNFIAAGIWASSFAMLGYGFYSLLRGIRKSLGPNMVHNIEIWVGLSLLVILVGWMVWFARKRNHLHTDETVKAAKPPKTPPPSPDKSLPPSPAKSLKTSQKSPPKPKKSA
ncbi:MAG: DedA family protein [Candidatus Pacebacteria bacterium]|nr:DedA family protein [Candidatus Paceibacterota bacterium]